MAARRFDVVVYGVTGFTGRLVGEYLARTAPKGVNWAIAGRTQSKLESARDHLQKLATDAGVQDTNIGVIVASTEKPDTLDQLAAQTRVVITTVGPFTLHGEPLVAACVRNRTDYVDSTGEAPWVADMMSKYGAEAKANGTLIVPMCGFDSIPSDLGTYMMVNHCRRVLHRPVSRVDTLVRIKGGASGGTISSIVELLRPSKIAQLRNPHLLCPPTAGGATPQQLAGTKAIGPIPQWHPIRKVWLGPFVMANVNSQVVRRSVCLTADVAGGGYSSSGTKFEYVEGQMFRSWFQAGLVGAITTVGGMLMFLLLLIPGVRSCFKKYLLPKPGTGPSDVQRSRSSFTYEMFAYPEGSTDPVTGRVAGGDPGYSETAKMLAESGLALALDRTSLPGHRYGGGFLTPSTAMGDVLLRRLRVAGMTFDVDSASS